MSSIKLITPPATEPITLAEAKVHCRVDIDDTSEDALISIYIAAARATAEKRMARAIIAQTWELAQDAFTEKIILPLAPIMSVTSVKYKDSAGAVQTVPSTDYALFDWGSFDQYVYSLTSWPAGSEVRIQYVAGFGNDETEVPQDMRSWLLLAIGTMYASRESIATQQGATSALPDNFADAFLDPYRVLSA